MTVNDGFNSEASMLLTLTDLPNVGKAIALDLVSIGVNISPMTFVVESQWICLMR